MATYASLYLDTRRRLNDGSCPVRISVGGGTRIYIRTGISVEPELWDPRACMYTGKAAKRVNAALGAALARVNTRMLELREKGLLSRLTRK